jgi:hypothetical protein
VGIGRSAIGTTFHIDKWTDHINSANKPFGYKTHESSTLLGNAPRAVRSRIYFKSTEVRDNYTTIIQ